VNATIYHSVINIAATCGLYLAGAMLVPAFVDIYYGHKDWEVFVLSAAIVGGMAGYGTGLLLPLVYSAVLVATGSYGFGFTVCGLPALVVGIVLLRAPREHDAR